MGYGFWNRRDLAAGRRAGVMKPLNYNLAGTGRGTHSVHWVNVGPCLVPARQRSDAECPERFAVACIVPGALEQRVLLAGAVGYGIYIGGLKLNLRRFFRWTGVFILVVAAGILANSVRALHEAGLWNHLQTVLFDMSPVLPLDSALGSVLAGIFGYIDAPTVGEAAAYLAFLLPSLWFFLADAPRPAARADAGQRV